MNATVLLISLTYFYLFRTQKFLNLLALQTPGYAGGVNVVI